jgi:hypothetical protein
MTQPDACSRTAHRAPHCTVVFGRTLIETAVTSQLRFACPCSKPPKVFAAPDRRLVVWRPTGTAKCGPAGVSDRDRPPNLVTASLAPTRALPRRSDLMRTEEQRGAAAARGPRAILTAAAVVTVLAGCAANDADQQAAPGLVTLKERTESTATGPAAPVGPQPAPPTADPNDEFIERCVEHILFTSYIGDAESQARWDAAGYDKARLRADCGTLAETDPAARSALAQKMDDLDAFLAAAAAEEARQERERADAQAAEDRRVSAYLEAVAAAANAAQVEEAERQGQALLDRLCGRSGGSYRYELNPVRVWLDRCNSLAGTGGSQGGDNSGEGGDRDCEDYGYEFEIDPSNDPDGLDGDGDGIACEGW